MLLSRSNLRISSPDSLRSFLEDDIRFDFDAFGNPDKTILKGMAESGHKPLCDYPNKDALLAAEPDEVKKVVDFSQNGTNYPAVVLSWIGFLPSGPAVFIYNEEGVRVDYCSDSGDNDSFLRRWHCAGQVRTV